MYNDSMNQQIFSNKTVRPTQLQPKLFSVINSLATNDDFKLIIDKDNNPLCYMVSYNLIKDIDLDKKMTKSDQDLEKDIVDYY